MSDSNAVVAAETTEPTTHPLSKLPIKSVKDEFAVLGMSVADFQETLADNLNGQQLTIADLDVYKVPNGGGKRFAVPSLNDDDAEEVDELRVIFLFSQPERTLWLTEFGKGEPGKGPDCRSVDGVTGISTGLYGVGSENHPSGMCDSCPMSQWIDNAPPKCAQKQRILMMMPDSLTPGIITLAPASLKPFNAYMKDLTKKNLRLSHVVTSIRLKVEVSARTGAKFSRPIFTPVAVLTAEERQAVSDYAGIMKTMFARRARPTVDAFDATEEPAALLEAPEEVAAATNGKKTKGNDF